MNGRTGISSASLTLWSPMSTTLPDNWVKLFEQLSQQARGKPHSYIMETRFDARRVGNRLRLWGLPWEVVMAGYLWEFKGEEIRQFRLQGTEKVIEHIAHATTYLGYIQDDKLPPLLTPPFDDLGGLLIACAIYGETFRMLQEISNNEPLYKTLRSDVERVGRTLISVAKRLGIWHFKREIEDTVEQLCSPASFGERKQDSLRVLQQDQAMLEDMRQWLIDTYRSATQQPVIVSCVPCSIGGLRRRVVDASIAHKAAEHQLRGFDLVTFEVIVSTVEECYRALGILSQLGFIQQMNDLIANPKMNGYSHIVLDLQLEQHSPFTQSLKWPGEQKCLCKIQIATPIMQAITWYGVLYPECYRLYTDSKTTKAASYASLVQLWHSKSGKVFSTLSENITTHHQHVDNKAPILVYESKSRKPIALKKGATVLDFAYTLDKTIGAHAVYAVVNNRNAPLYRILDADDIVEIITSSEIQAKESWLQAGNTTIPAVRKQIRKSLHDRHGYKLLAEELERYHHILPPEVLEQQLSTLVKQHSLGTVQSYLERLNPTEELIYTPQWAAQEIMQHLAEHNETPVLSEERMRWIPVIATQLTEQKQYYQQQRFCNFCQPNYPYDKKLMGRIRKRDNVLVVHKESCPRLLEHSSHSTSSLFSMVWQRQSVFQVAFYMAAQDRRGLILDLVRLLRRYHCDLLSISADAFTKYGEARIRFTIEAHSYSEVIDIWQALYRVDNITKADIDASATPIQVYDHLQQLRQRKESIPQLSLAEFLEEPPIQEMRGVMLENPFDISHPPISKMFFGRSAEMEKMRRELCDALQGRSLILHGPRRSGKTSICTNFLENNVRPPFVGVLFSLLSDVEHDEETILRRLAHVIREQFYRQLHQTTPEWNDFSDADVQDRFRKFLESCLDKVPHSRLILILDEFGGAIQSYEKRILKHRFFTQWKELIERVPQLSLVFVLPTSSHNRLTSKEFANVFSSAGTLPLEFLDTTSARQLLIDPLQEQGIQIFSNTAALATKLAGGNPYYMTLFGRELINYLNRETSLQHITDRDLRLVTDQLIQPGTHQYFDYLRGEIQSETEMRLIQGLVEITIRTRESKVQLKRLVQMLDLSPSVARRHLDRLRYGLILNTFGAFSNPYYAFKIELIRKWLTRNQWFFLDESHS